jgi:hypothetical protein
MTQSRWFFTCEEHARDEGRAVQLALCTGVQVTHSTRCTAPQCSTVHTSAWSTRAGSMQVLGSVSRIDEDNNWLDIGSRFRRRAMLWFPRGRPERVLIVKKHNDERALGTLRQMAEWCAAVQHRKRIDAQRATVSAARCARRGQHPGPRDALLRAVMRTKPCTRP